MPVQIPKLKSLGPVDPESVGRIRGVEVPDGSRVIGQIGDAVEKIGSKAIDYFQKQEDDQIDMLSREAASKYEVKKKVAMKQAQQYEGNPDEVYSKMDADSITWENEVMEQYSNVSDRAKRLIKDRIGRVNFHLNDQVAVNREIQAHGYDQKQTDSRVALAAERAMSAMEHPNEVTSLANLRGVINDLKDERMAFGRRRELLIEKRDQDGNVIGEEFAPSVRLQIKKDVTNTLDGVIRTLHRSRKTKLAEQIMEEYKDDILSDTKAKLLDNKEKTTLEIEALGYVDKATRESDPANGAAIIDRIKDLKVKKIAEEEYYSRVIHRSKIQELSQKQALESLHDEFRNLQKGGAKFLTETDIDKNPIFQSFVENNRITAKQARDFKKVIIPDEKDKDDVLTKMNDKLVNGEFRGMSSSVFLQESAGLTQKTRDKFQTHWRRINEDTDVEKTKAVTNMSKEIQKQLYAAGKVGEPQGEVKSKKHQRILNDFRSRLFEELDTMDLSPKAQEDWVKKQVSTFVKDGKFAPPEKKKFNGVPSYLSPNTSSKESSAPTRRPTPQQLNRANAAWAKDHGGKPWNSKTDNKEEFMKYIKWDEE